MSNSNEPAYPTATMSGLTKRELLAAMAMQGMLASLASDESAHEGKIAEWSVSQADALLAELAKKEVES